MVQLTRASTLLFVVLITLAVAPGDTRGYESASIHKLYLPYVVTSSPLRIGRTALSNSRGPGFVIRGEVINLTNSPIYSVTVQVHLFDGSRLMSTSKDDTMSLPATLSGEFNIFEVSAPPIGYFREEPTHYTVEITSWETHSATAYEGVTIISAGLCETQSVFTNRFCAELRNDHPHALRDVRVLVVSVDARQGSLQIHEFEHLAAGGTLSLNLDPPNDYIGNTSWLYDTRITGQGIAVP